MAPACGDIGEGWGRGRPAAARHCNDGKRLVGRSRAERSCVRGVVSLVVDMWLLAGSHAALTALGVAGSEVLALRPIQSLGNGDGGR